MYTVKKLNLKGYTTYEKLLLVVSLSMPVYHNITTLTHTCYFHDKCVMAHENQSDIIVAEFLKNAEISFFDQSLNAWLQEINY